MIVLETDRLVLSRFSVDDAEFILGLLNEPSFLENIGDKGVRTLEGARNYLLGGPIDSYERFGFGLYLTTLKESGVPIGTCGLLKRDSLDDADVGFAFLPAYFGEGYATESAGAVVAYANRMLGLSRIVSIVSPTNSTSIHVLEKIGLRYDRPVRLSEDGDEISLYSIDLTQG
ncbi:MAG: GNAT family N-acetyltransferase [Gemmatimonadota bacterium]